MDEDVPNLSGSIPGQRSIPPVSSSTGEHAEPIAAAGKRDGFVI